jgi:long-chain acyl-CoA synthetase
MALALHEVDPKRPGDEFVSFLPLAWIGEQMMSLSSALAVGFTVNFPEEPETVMENIREIGPHVMFAPPRIWENLNSTVQVKIMDTSWFKRRMYGLCMPVGYKVADLDFAKKPVPLGLRILYRLAWWGLFRALKDRLGFTYLRSGSTGGAALGPDVFRFFHAIGVPLKQIYGQTEIAGISVLHRDGDVKFDTVGFPLPETEVRIAPDGEILSRGPCVFRGYYKMPEETERTLKDGWLHSGDIGFIDDDRHLVVFDRRKDVMELADGSRFSPAYLETRLKYSPYIKDAWVLGHGRAAVTAAVCIDAGVVGKWAEDHHIPYTSYAELSQKPQVGVLVAEAVAHVNRGLPQAARVRRFVNLHKEFDADDDELTRTRKLRRAFLEERYRVVVEGLYGEADKIHFTSTVTYEDGRVAHSAVDLRVITVAEA